MVETLKLCGYNLPLVSTGDSDSILEKRWTRLNHLEPSKKIFAQHMFLYEITRQGSSLTVLMSITFLVLSQLADANIVITV